MSLFVSQIEPPTLFDESQPVPKYCENRTSKLATMAGGGGRPLLSNKASGDPETKSGSLSMKNLTQPGALLNPEVSIKQSGNVRTVHVVSRLDEGALEWSQFVREVAGPQVPNGNHAGRVAVD